MNDKIQNKIDGKTKPLGSLGALEKIAYRVAKVQQTLSPELIKPTIVVFAGDHGIAREGVSAYPAEVTPQMVQNFLAGGAAINVFCRRNNIDLKIVDSGVNFDFPPESNLIDARIAHGTKSFLAADAMTAEQLDRCRVRASEIVDEIARGGTNIIGFGEMGIGNTSSASMLMHYICDIPLDRCVGRGTGADDVRLQHKLQILRQARKFHGDVTDASILLQKFGGFEVAQMTYAMLAAYRNNMLIMVDGFIATASFLVACKLDPRVLDNALFCHQGDESGHKLMLDFLHVKAILQLGLRLGEGTGCALAYPVIQNAVDFMNSMSSFSEAKVSGKSAEL